MGIVDLTAFPSGCDTEGVGAEQAVVGINELLIREGIKDETLLPG